jgi:putative endonuclease
MHWLYILYSDKLNRFYIGSTKTTVEERLDLHLKKIFGNKSFTAKANDWKIKLSLKCDNISHARQIERFLKRMKSKKFIEKFIADESFQNDILIKCNSEI